MGLLSLSSLHNAEPNGHMDDMKNGSPISLSGPEWMWLPSPHTEPRGCVVYILGGDRDYCFPVFGPSSSHGHSWGYSSSLALP